mmetsp:Transcript_33560/g.38144  ORF Transcript_33560/g.38144 Transcript_33560/m.38144 type:complete len:87 (+) Transcript_33560:109-369(+)
MYPIYIKTLSRETVTIDVDYNTTFLDIKILVVRKTCGRVIPKFLIYAGKRLEDDRTISDYGMCKECTAHALTEKERSLSRAIFHGS